MSNSHYVPQNKNLKEEKTVHDHEHASWTRRSFIQALGLAGAGSIMVGHAAITASRPSPLSVALANSENDNILIIIRLKGGNDGLNTIVPIYDYASYANLRPSIKHRQSKLTNLNDDFAIPKFMKSLDNVWGDGAMKVVHGVGYPQQNLSHFRSSEIWESADNIHFEPTGWWGRYFEDLYPDYLINPPDMPPAMQIGSIGNLIFEGNDNNYSFSVANPKQLADIAMNGTLHDVTNLPDCVYGDKLLFMRAVTNTTFNYAGVIHNAYRASTNQANYSAGNLAKQLAIVARMIKGGLGTKVYMVTLGSFDTHANQVDKHAALLEDLADSLKYFYQDLASAGMEDKVLSMTISEFGRRPYENGSNGTDHGAASPVMLFGNGLNGSGFVGQHPDLNTWDDNDNLIPTSDFRDVYSTVLTDWFCLDHSVVKSILLHHNYKDLDLGFSCNSAANSRPFNETSQFANAPVYKNDRTYIDIEMTNTANVNIKLYDILGREVGTLTNEILHPGKYSIDVKTNCKGRLSNGHYIYRITVGGANYSKSIIIK